MPYVALVVEDTIFNKILKVDIKMTMPMELEIQVEVIRLRCVLTQDVERMPYASRLIVLSNMVNESTRVDIQI